VEVNNGIFGIQIMVIVVIQLRSIPEVEEMGLSKLSTGEV